MKYIKIAYYFFKENLYYWQSILARSIFLILLCVLITTLVWVGINFQNIQIWWISFSNYMWYIWITELVILSSLGRNFFQEIISWEVINYLLRPINFLFLFWWKIFGAKLVMIWILAIFSFPIILILNHFNFPDFNLFIFLVVFICWISISVLIDTFSILLAFWIENTSFLRLIIQKFYFIFWWLFFPLEIYPLFLKTIADSLPFKFALQLPAKYFASWNIEFLFKNNQILLLIIWFIALIVLNFLLFNKLKKVLQINGG